MLDIFLDTNCMANVTSPRTDEYKTFYSWLMESGALVVNNKLLVEYFRGNRQASIIIGKLQSSGRLNKIENRRLSDFRFSKNQESKFYSNRADRNHIKTVILSHRGLAISCDSNFVHDICNIPRQLVGRSHSAASSPERINYRGIVVGNSDSKIVQSSEDATNTKNTQA